MASMCHLQGGGQRDAQCYADGSYRNDKSCRSIFLNTAACHNTSLRQLIPYAVELAEMFADEAIETWI